MLIIFNKYSVFDNNIYHYLEFKFPLTPHFAGKISIKLRSPGVKFYIKGPFSDENFLSKPEIDFPSFASAPRSATYFKLQKKSGLDRWYRLHRNVTTMGTHNLL